LGYLSHLPKETAAENEKKEHKLKWVLMTVTMGIEREMEESSNKYNVMGKR
jgi:hypothetical protein